MPALFLDLSVAWRNLVRQGRRSAIAIGVVAFGVVALMLAGGFIDWLLHAMRESTIRSQFGHIQVVRSGAGAQDPADPFSGLLPESAESLRWIEHHPHVATVGSRLSFSGMISRNDATLSFIGQGVEPASERMLSTSLHIADGSDLDEADRRGVILGRGLARNLGVRPGETVVLMTATASGGVNAIECTVRGLFVTASKAYDDVALRAPISAARDLLRVRGSHAWVILLDQTEETLPVLRSMHDHLAAESVKLIPWFEMTDMYNKTVALFGRQVAALKVIVAVIIVLSISSAMMMNVVERTGEIGTSMALGLRRRGLVKLFLLEGLMLGLSGGALGLVTGSGVAWLVSAIGIPMPPPPGMEVGYTAQVTLGAALVRDAFLLALVTALLASLYPAWKASRLPIVDALRHNR